MRTQRFSTGGALIALLATGCGPAMHGMHGMHGSDGTHGGTTQSSGVSGLRVEKEVREGTRVATLVVPPLRVGEETTLSLVVVNTTTGRPEAGLLVTLALASSGQTEHALGHSAGSDGHDMGAASIASAATPGTYTIKHVFSAPGSVDIIATVSGDSGRSPLTVSVAQEVQPAAAGPGHTARGQTRWPLLGGLAMAVLMAIMFTSL